MTSSFGVELHTRPTFLDHRRDRGQSMSFQTVIDENESPALGRRRPPLGNQLFTRGSRVRWSAFEPTRDGRFIALEPVQYAAEQPLHLILNWPASVH